VSASSANVAGLIALSPLNLTLALNLFTGGLRGGDGLSDRQVAVRSYSGTPDETFTVSDFRPQVQVSVRGNPDQYNEAEKLANDLWLYLANVRNIAVPDIISGQTVGPVVIQALTPSGTVNPLGVDDKQRSLFSMNFTVAI